MAPPPNRAGAGTDGTSPSTSSQQAQAWVGTVFTNHKAGMGEVDMNRVKQIVYDMSKDSAHFKNEKRKDEQTDRKVRQLQERERAITKRERAALESRAKARIAELEATRDLSRTWLHVDMDMFYAACEQLDAPHLKDVPFAVGGKSMISTANYAARKYGVRSAMPGFIALKLCPHLHFVRPDFSKYTLKAEEVRGE